MKKWFFVLLVFSMLYTVLRYLVFGPVVIANAPVYLVNKVVAMLSVFALYASSWAALKGRQEDRGRWDTVAGHSYYLHLLLSLALLSPAYYTDFFSQSKMNLLGELSVLSGVAALYLLFFHRHRRASQLAARLFVALHLAAMGARGWLTPSTWNGHMPPISLLCFLTVLASCILLLRAPGCGKDRASI